MSIATSREEPLLLEMIHFVLVLVWLFTHNQSNIYSSNRLVFFLPLIFCSIACHKLKIGSFQPRVDAHCSC